MIKITDLMIGDYVTFADCIENPPFIPIKIVALGFQDGGDEKSSLVSINNDKACDIIDIDEEIVGIPLTPEILEKNGFTKCDTDEDGAIQYEFGESNLGIDIWLKTEPALLGAWRQWDEYNEPYSMVNELPINYVHELQHALKLCKIDKKITL